MSAHNAAVEAWELRALTLADAVSDAVVARLEADGTGGDIAAAKDLLLAHLRTTPEGWQLVPVEPTEAISRVLRNEGDIYPSEDALYAALLSAVKEGGAG